MNADGSGVSGCTNSPGLDQNPAWSPNGGRIVFDSDRAGTLDVWVMNADGSGPANLTDHPALDALAVFSPDGRKIAFVSDRGGDRDIWEMPAGGGSPTRLTSTPGDEMTPDWGVPAAAGGSAEIRAPTGRIAGRHGRPGHHPRAQGQ